MEYPFVIRSLKSKNYAGQGIAHVFTVGNEMEVDLSPTSTSSSKALVNIKNEGIDIDTSGTGTYESTFKDSDVSKFFIYSIV